jgi:DNA-binding response OmpR family regulator
MGRRILAVDDETDVLMILKTALQSEGFEVETAGNGADGLALAKENPPDLILLDVMMPGMSGFDVFQQLKEDDATSQIPVIMLTGMSERKNIQSALAAGIEYYIVKPFEFHDLLTKVNHALTGE